MVHDVSVRSPSMLRVSASHPEQLLAEESETERLYVTDIFVS